MKKSICNGVFAALLVLAFGYSLTSNADVNFNITLPGPGLASPPALVVVPGTNVYFAPDVRTDLFFYNGYWYRPYRSDWYFSAEYNGPWGRIAIGTVPPPLVNLPSDYRQIPPGYERMPYATVKRNWRRWEEEGYWDHYHEEKGPGMGHRGHGGGMGMGR